MGKENKIEDERVVRSEMTKKYITNSAGIFTGSVEAADGSPNINRGNNKPPYCCLFNFSHSVDATQPTFQK